MTADSEAKSSLVQFYEHQHSVIFVHVVVGVMLGTNHSVLLKFTFKRIFIGEGSGWISVKL